MFEEAKCLHISTHRVPVISPKGCIHTVYKYIPVTVIKTVVPEWIHAGVLVSCFGHSHKLVKPV